MTDTSTPFGGPQPRNVNTYNPIASVTFPVGTAVAQSVTGGEEGKVHKARATSANTTFVTGLAASPGVEGDRVNVQFGGVLTLATAEWDAVISGGSGGGLVTGELYFLSIAGGGSGSGKITSTAPSAPGNFVAPVGVALSPTELMLRLGFPAEVPLP